MPLGYNPRCNHEGSGGRIAAGTYSFRIEDAEEVSYRSGNQGLATKLAVSANGREITVRSNLVYTEKALWKLKQFLDSTGFDFNEPPEVGELLGRTGWAKFELNERGYLKVDEYLKGSPPRAAPRHHVGGQSFRGRNDQAGPASLGV